MDQKKIGSFIAARRKDNGLTQSQLVETLGITDKAVSKWETGISHLQYICDENENLTSYPRFSWYMKPLPISEQNKIRICCKNEDEISNNSMNIYDDLIMAQKHYAKMIEY